MPPYRSLESTIDLPVSMRRTVSYRARLASTRYLSSHKNIHAFVFCLGRYQIVLDTDYQCMML